MYIVYEKYTALSEWEWRAHLCMFTVLTLQLGHFVTIFCICAQTLTCVHVHVCILCERLSHPVVDKTAALKRMQGGKYSHVPPAVATTLCALLLRLQLLLTDIAVCTSLLLTTTCTHWLLRNAIL